MNFLKQWVFMTLILFLILAPVSPLRVQAQPETPEVTPEPTTEAVQPVIFVTPVQTAEPSQPAPVVIVDVPDGETAEDAALTTLQNIILGLITLIAALVGLLVKFGVDFSKSLRQSQPLQLGFTGAVNIARFTPSSEDDTKIEKVLNENGFEINKNGPIWTIIPKQLSSG